MIDYYHYYFQKHQRCYNYDVDIAKTTFTEHLSNPLLPGKDV